MVREKGLVLVLLQLLLLAPMHAVAAPTNIDCSFTQGTLLNTGSGATVKSSKISTFRIKDMLSLSKPGGSWALVTKEGAGDRFLYLRDGSGSSSVFETLLKEPGDGDLETHLLNLRGVKKLFDLLLIIKSDQAAGVWSGILTSHWANGVYGHLAGNCFTH